MASRVTIERTGANAYRVRAPAYKGRGTATVETVSTPAAARKKAEEFAKRLEAHGWTDVTRSWVTEGINERKHLKKSPAARDATKIAGPRVGTRGHQLIAERVGEVTLKALTTADLFGRYDPSSYAPGLTRREAKKIAEEAAGFVYNALAARYGEKA